VLKQRPLANRAIGWVKWLPQVKSRRLVDTETSISVISNLISMGVISTVDGFEKVIKKS
jgi:hypothetical protein